MIQASVEAVTANGSVTDFYIIGELAERFGVNCGTIRFYERQGLLAPIRHGRMRMFTIKDANRLKQILELREMGLPVKTIRKLLDHEHEFNHHSVRSAVNAALQHHKEDLIRRQHEIGLQLRAVRQKLGEPSDGG